MQEASAETLREHSLPTWVILNLQVTEAQRMIKRDPSFIFGNHTNIICSFSLPKEFHMCGIFGIIGKRSDTANSILTGLKTLEYRGYDSWGVAVIPADNTGTIAVKKRIGKIGTATVSDMPESTLGIGHTRWATHGGVTQVNAHPHLDCTGTIAIIHNGIVENYEDLQKTLLSHGTHTIISETDSEIIAHCIEDAKKTGTFAEAVRKTFLGLVGCNAVIAIASDSRMIVACKKGSPLVVGFGKEGQYIASDVAAILPYTNAMYFLEDGDMAVLTDETIRILDAETGKEKTVTPQTIDWQKSATEKNGFPTFMLKEIHEQPAIIREIGKQHTDEDQLLAKRIRGTEDTYLIGCGTAYYACIAGSYLFSQVAKRHINTCVASEFGYQEDFLTKKSLVIALSQSGETMDLIEAVKLAKTHDATITGIVNSVGSTLWRMSTNPVSCGAGPEIGVASTKDLTAKLTHLIMLAHIVAGTKQTGMDHIELAAAACQNILEPISVKKIRDIAEKIMSNGHCFVVGRGLSYPAALETALKIKEISYMHAEGFAAGELKHGPIALIESGTPCIVFLPDDETFGANLAAAMEMKARGGHIIGIASHMHPIFDDFLEVANCKEATIIPNIVTGQLLAYYLTIAKDIDPDKPRNLAKSVTVK